MKHFSRKFLRRVVVTLGILLLAGGSYYLLRYQAWAAYRNWSISRMNVMARDFIAAGDTRNALLTVRKVLGKRPNDIEAWRLGVQAARKNDTGEVVYYQRNLRRVEPTAENQLELIRLALKYRAYQTALTGVTNATPEATALPEYHRLAVEIYRLAGREALAQEHLVSLLKQVPDDVPAQLALAETEFEQNAGQVPADWSARVGRLAGKPGMELPAAMLQLRYATARRDSAAAAPLLARLRGRVDLSVKHRLQLLEAVELCEPGAAPAFLAELQKSSEKVPAETAQVMVWLARQSRWPDVTAWYAQLPEAGRKDDAIKLFAARALEQRADWPALEQLLRGPAWSVEEAQRLALLARAYQMLGRTADFAESWKLAVIAGGQNLRSAMRLLQTVTAWGWPEQKQDVVWRIFNLAPTNPTVRDDLIAHEFIAGNTVNLNRIYARIIEAAPEDDEARNNFAYTSLLLDTNLGRAQTIARSLHRKYPDNVSYLTTYTLALHKDGKSAEALSLLEALGPVARLSRSVVLHEATYAAASGHIKRAAELLPQLARVRMLPEESQLVAAIRVAVAKDGTRQEQQQLLAASSVSAPGGWLGWLPDKAKEASNELRLSDAFYRDGNFKALVELTQGPTWKQDDHLRHALAAYGQRQQAGERGSREEWRQAMAAAGRDGRRLRDLQELATHWKWDGERMEVTARRFERESSDPVLLAELLDFYRKQSRTTDLARTLWLYVKETNSTGKEAAWCVYYSLLCEMDVNSAQTLAYRVYTAAPKDASGQVAYAFALWRQHRSAEAWSLLRDVSPTATGGMQVVLLQAAVLLDLERKPEARLSLARFIPGDAMPEEKIFADTLSRRIGLENATAVLTTNAPSHD